MNCNRYSRPPLRNKPTTCAPDFRSSCTSNNGLVLRAGGSRAAPALPFRSKQHPPLENTRRNRETEQHHALGDGETRLGWIGRSRPRPPPSSVQLVAVCSLLAPRFRRCLSARVSIRCWTSHAEPEHRSQQNRALVETETGKKGHGESKRKSNLTCPCMMSRGTVVFPCPARDVGRPHGDRNPDSLRVRYV